MVTGFFFLNGLFFSSFIVSQCMVSMRGGLKKKKNKQVFHPLIVGFCELNPVNIIVFNNRILIILIIEKATISSFKEVGFYWVC